MTTHRLWLALVLGLALACPLQAEQTATVTGNRVNVRGKATLNSEVITQLSQGDSVTVHEQIEVSGAKAGEPQRWAKIRLPAGTTVFVFAPYIDVGTKRVKVSRLNLRGGPGENYSVLGRIPRGSQVQEVQTTASWMEIQAPTNAYAFMSTDFLKLEESEVEVETGADQTTAPTEETPDVATEEPEPTVVSEPIPTTPWPEGAETEAADTDEETVVVEEIPTVPSVPRPAPEEELPPRIVYREGRVVEAMSIQAPSRFGLMSLESRRLINYLHTEKEGLKLKAFAGKDVRVKGEELLDARWATPLIEVEDIRLSPK